MSALAAADHEETQDTLLAARARIEHLEAALSEAEHESRLVRARNDRLERESVQLRQYTIKECIERVEQGFGKDCAVATTLRHHFGVKS